MASRINAVNPKAFGASLAGHGQGPQGPAGFGQSVSADHLIPRIDLVGGVRCPAARSAQS